MTTANSLSSLSLSRRMVASLPPGATPQLKNAFDAIALAAHASFLAVGFRLVGLGEDHKIEATSEPSDPQPLPTEWNGSSGSHAFRYAHTQSSMEFLLKASRMGNKAVIMGMALGDDRNCSFDVTAKDYVSEEKLPCTPSTQDAGEEEAAHGLMSVFLSDDRLSDFGNLMRIKIIQKLAPGIHKEGYEERYNESREEALSHGDPYPRRGEPDRPRRDPLREGIDPAPARPSVLLDPLAPPGRFPQRPLPEPIPGFEDEFEAQRPLRGAMPYPGPGGYPRIGDRDLYPQGLGPNDPLRGGVGPGFGGFGGGMHPTFDDPLFAGQGQRGDQGYDPQAPPGSRYDPVGPDMGGHPRGAGMGGGPPNPFGGFGGGDFI